MELLIFLAAVALPLYWKRPAIGLLIHVALQALIFGGSWEVSESKVLYAAYFGLCALLWFPGAAATFRQTLRVPFMKWLVAMFVLFLFSRLVGLSNGLSTIDWFRELSPLLNYAFAFLGVYAFSLEPDLNRYLRWVMFVLMGLSFPAAATWMWYRGFLSASTPLMSLSNASPGVFMGGLFIAINLASEPGRSKVGYSIAALFFLGCMLITGSRTEFASAFLGCGLLAILYMRRGDLALGRIVKIAGVSFAGVALTVTALALSGAIDTSDITERFLSATRSDILEDQTVTNRVAETLDAWQAFTEGPVFGKGLGFQTNTVYEFGHVSFVVELYFIHNMYAYILAKFGILGFVVIAGFYISIIMTAMRSFFRCRDFSDPAFYGTFACLTVALLVESITANQFLDRTASSIYGLLAALLVFKLSRATPTGEFKTPGPIGA